MRTSISPSAVCLPLLALILAGLAGLGFWTAGGSIPGFAEEKKGRQKKEEVEEADKPADKRPPRKTPRREEVEETDLVPDESRPVDLVALAKRADGEIRTFYENLAFPHDDVVWKPRGRVDHVEPLSVYVGHEPRFSGEIKMVRFDKDGKRRPLLPATSKQIKEIIPFEETVLKAADEILKPKDLPRLRAAENAIVFALRFHASGRVKKPEDTQKWMALEDRLRERLHELRRDHVVALSDARQWDEAFRLAEQLVKEHPREPEDHWSLARVALARAEDSGKPEDYQAARRRLIAFESRFPLSPKAEPLRKALITAAQKLMDEADALMDKDAATAIARLRSAAKIWPQLPGLQDRIRARDRAHPILYVGVRKLPEFFSPAAAVSDTERQAVELLFEALVKPSTAAGGALHYNGALAEARPRVVPCGREFSLARDAFWSDGNPVTGADVRETVKLLKDQNLPGRDSAWAKLVSKTSVEVNAYRVRITLSHGYLDPLSLLTFKVLPSQFRGKPLERANDEDFAAHPVGSGPFVLQGPLSEDDMNYLVFSANPFYQRADRPGRPHIREIRFFVSTDPAKELRSERLHLLPDVRTDEIKTLRGAGFREDDIRTLTTRRVYFLAVNHGNEELENEDLRQAIAQAIDRETLLKAHFRAGYEALDRDGRLVKAAGVDTVKLHPALNGPYPAGSWACSPDVRPSLFDLDRARLKATAALRKLKSVELKLSYPNDDPRVAAACKDICGQVARVSDRIQITPVGLAPKDFRKAIIRREYDLAYCHYDYASEAFWLWPLFDPDKNARAPGGSNYLRYSNDGALDNYFIKAMTHRDFNEVKKFTHAIHARLNEKMPLIPLWQLHRHIAIHPQVDAAGLDPLLVFTNVEEWRLEKK